MKLKLVRENFNDTCTQGSLYANGVFQCFTLEDALRGNGDAKTVAKWKVAGKSCIPYGTYEIKLHNSPRFRRILPWLQNVQGFQYILIHSGNTAADTEGCILVGLTRNGLTVGNSRAAMDILQPQIQAALDRGEEVTIEVGY